MRAHIDLFAEVFDHEKVEPHLDSRPALLLGPTQILWVDLPPDEARQYLQALSDAALKLREEIRARQLEEKR